MKILVIIVSYNFERWIDRCLESLRHASQKVDVIVVDNASQDCTVELIENNYPEVRLIKSKENLGFGRANNIGMKIALEEGYDVVFLLNQDAWIDTKVLEVLSESSRKDSRYGILSPVHLTGSGERLEQGFANYASLNSLKDVKGEALIPLPFINAAFWMIPTSVLQQTGGFCPLFYHYGEDVDYVNRLRYYGYLVGYSPNVFGCHDRECRKVSHKAWLHSERIYLLTEYANINYSFLKAFGYGVLAGIKKSCKALIKGDMSTGTAYIGITLQLLGRTREVLHYRKANKNSKGNALYLTD